MLLAADIWDTAGQDRFNSLHPSYYYRAHACLMVFDVTRKVTYKNLDRQVAGRPQLLRCKVRGCVFRRMLSGFGSAEQSEGAALVQLWVHSQLGLSQPAQLH